MMHVKRRLVAVCLLSCVLASNVPSVQALPKIDQIRFCPSGVIWKLPRGSTRRQVRAMCGKPFKMTESTDIYLVDRQDKLTFNVLYDSDQKYINAYFYIWGGRL